jgi:magnesium chelatase family protein
LVSACRRLGLTARGYDRVRRVARTLADLEPSDEILEHHVAEAVQYRRAVNPPS